MNWIKGIFKPRQNNFVQLLIQQADLTAELTREAIWEALYNRRCYATQGQRTLLHFALDEYPMGAVISQQNSARYAERRPFRCGVASHRAATRIEVVRCDGETFDLTPEHRLVD